MPDIVAVLRASTSDFTAKMAAAREEIKTTEATGSSSFSKLGTISKAALLGVGAAAVGVGVAAVDFGDKLEASQASLQAALQASGTSWNSVKGSVAATGAAATHYGFTQAQIDAALAQGVISTQNYGSAHRNLQVAIQLAAARHIDLSTAMQMVDKAAIGQTRALKQMGIDLPVVQSNALKVKQAHDALAAAQLAALGILRQYPDAVDASSKHHAAYETALLKVAGAQHKLSEEQGAGQQILDALQKRLSGQASAAADTFAGRIAAAKAQGENLAANIGVRLIPVLERLMSIVMGVVTWLENHRTVAIALGIAIGVVTAAMLALAVATAIMEAVASPLLVPILAIIAALAVLGFAAYEIVKHWGAIAKFFKDLWHDVEHIFDVAIHAITDFIRKWWPEILGIFTGGLGLLVGLVIQHWSQVRAETVRVLDDVVNFFTALPGRIVGALGDIVSTIWNGFLRANQWILDHVITPVVNTFTGLPSKIVSGLGDIVGFIWNALLQANTWIVNNVINPVVTTFTGLPGKIVSALGAIVSFIFNALLQAGNWINTNVIQPVVSYFTALPDNIVSGMGNIVSKIWSGLTTAASWVNTNVIQPVVGFFQGIGTTIKNALSAVEGIIEAPFQAAWNVIKPIFDAIKSAIDFITGSNIGATPNSGKSPPAPGTAPTPGRAAGGSVNALTPYLVGERGPELFVPGGAGTIMPNGAFGGGNAGPVTIQFNLDSQQFFQATFPSLWSVLLQNQRWAGTLNLT